MEGTADFVVERGERIGCGGDVGVEIFFCDFANLDMLV
jgi:hypothetical protein